MPYVLFYSKYKSDGPRVIENTTDHYSIHRDDYPMMHAMHKVETDKRVACWGVAKIDEGSEPQWMDNELL
jgi:hypothetical protein